MPTNETGQVAIKLASLFLKRMVRMYQNTTLFAPLIVNLEKFQLIFKVIFRSSRFLG